MTRRVLLLALSILAAWFVAFGAEERQLLPEELTRIAKLNLASLGQLRTCSATVEDSFVDATGDRQAPLNVSRTLTVWVKGRKFREDYVVKRDKGSTDPSKAILDLDLA